MNCPICTTPSKQIFSVAGSPVYRCLACSHAFSDSSQSSNAIYTAEYFQITHRNWFAHPNIPFFKRIHQLISRHHNRQASVIDVGCGIGDLLKYLQKTGYIDLTGIDLVQNDHPGICFFSGDLLEYTSDRKYDVVISTGTIEHIPNALAYVEKITQLTKNGGMIIIMTLNEQSLIYRLARILRRLGLSFAVNRLYEEHHVNHFTRQSLRTLFSGELAQKSGPIRLERILSHNFPIKSIDTPPGIFRPIIFLAIIAIFAISKLTKSEMLQTQIYIKE